MSSKLWEDFAAGVRACSNGDEVADVTVAVRLLFDRVVELEELVTKTRRRRCGCCNSEVCEYE